ncbi:ABC transporter ATP-binding protein [Alsobacter sp. SYSU M60028]|uniref:ABC transporter ATP-binding protein n=1 Tax=Alsobacter ponti TaxID=2962936 RepID=A0ABT1LG57_9HYPH|nr:ABC transporter ATP-binding protein [Alsobacter ponti]MCP8939710.1 ABC transporter ATP-binding protein [Alsobacter ponti]
MSATAPALVSLAGVGKAFDNGVVALQGVDLAVAEGEFLALLGPSGCGKTTVLRLIAGLDEPSAGAIAGQALAAREGGLGYVFQDATLLPWANVADNVFLPLRLAGVARRDADERIAAMLRLVGIDGFAGALPHQLSGGMRMRVAIARALVTRPRLLLMDEPFAALDEITRFRLNDDLLRLKHETGCTVVFVTHSVYEAVYLSTRVAVMSARPGRILREIAVDLPARRDDALRRDPAYLALCAEASAALHAALAGSPA